MMRLMLLIPCYCLMVFGAGSSMAAVAYSTVLLPENVRGPVPVQQDYAWGQATLIVDDSEQYIRLTWNVDGLETDLVGVHLLHAEEHEAGVVLVVLDALQFHAVQLEYTQDIRDALVNLGVHGNEPSRLAIQVSDQRYQHGAIRGNFIHQTVDNDKTTWSRVKDLFQ